MISALLFFASTLSSAQADWVDPGFVCWPCKQHDAENGIFTSPYPWYNQPVPSYWPWFQQPIYPWYTTVGWLNYPNFFYPGPWGNNGINPRPFPGNQQFFADKPNLYVSGSEGTEFEIQVEMKEGGNWLASVPRALDQGWKGVITQNPVTKEQKLRSGGAEYRYLFYDYRGNEKPLQDTQGFCTTREHLLVKMSQGLRASGFRPNEIHDFEEYWSVKIPPSRKYCVYPQENEELAKIAPITATPSPKRIKRLVYFVFTSEALAGRSDEAKFAHEPAVVWVAHGAERIPASSDTSIELREWGVAFPQAK